MTHEKAIEIINRKSSIPNNDECFEDIETAYNMATSALKKQIATNLLYQENQNSDIEGIHIYYGQVETNKHMA